MRLIIAFVTLFVGVQAFGITPVHSSLTASGPNQCLAPPSQTRPSILQSCRCVRVVRCVRQKVEVPAPIVDVVPTMERPSKMIDVANVIDKEVRIQEEPKSGMATIAAVVVAALVYEISMGRKA